MPEKKEAKANTTEKPSTSQIIFEKAKAGYAALYLVSAEDMRSQREIKEAAKDLERKLYVWTLGRGLVEDGAKASAPMPQTEDPAAVLERISKTNDVGKPYVSEGSIVILRLFHHFMDDPLIQSRLLDLMPLLKTSRRMLVVLTPVIKLPLELEKEFALIETQLPGKRQLSDVLDGIIVGTNLEKGLHPSEERREEVLEAALGLTSNEAENAMTLSIIRPRIEIKAQIRRESPRITDKELEKIALERSLPSLIWDPKIVMEEKCAALKKTGLLEYIPVDPRGLNQVGGLRNLKEWIRKRKNAFTQRARDFGLPPPKGMLSVGPAGAGKSLCAKAISGELVLPLLRLDMGKMFGSLVGQSEANIRMAIQVAEALAPCILWVN